MTTDILRVRQPDIGRNEAPALHGRERAAKNPPATLLPRQNDGDGKEITGMVKIPEMVTKATPEKLVIATLPDDRLRVSVGMETIIEQEGTSYIARCDALDEFGYGDSPLDAVEDLKSAIVELYWTLKVEREQLGPDMARIWARLNGFVEQR